jgi:hypothetical protein
METNHETQEQICTDGHADDNGELRYAARARILREGYRFLWPLNDEPLNQDLQGTNN